MLLHPREFECGGSFVFLCHSYLATYLVVDMSKMVHNLNILKAFLIYFYFHKIANTFVSYLIKTLAFIQGIYNFKIKL